MTSATSMAKYGVSTGVLGHCSGYEDDQSCMLRILRSAEERQLADRIVPAA